MSRYIRALLSLTAGLALTATLACSTPADAPAAGSTSSTTADPAQAALGIKAYMEATQAPTGTITVQGVVSGSRPEQSLLLLVDDGDGECVGTACCAMLTLPVRWTGAAPDDGTAVTVTGQAVSEDGKLIFIASSVMPRQPTP